MAPERGDVAVAQLLERINARHATALRLGARYAEGENQGAYALADAAGARFVLKYQRRPGWLRMIERARLVTDRLRALGSPVPEYRLLGEFADGAVYWVQGALPGAPPRALTDGHLDQLLALIDLQAGRAISGEQDWSDYVTRVVFTGESGWAGSLRGHSGATLEVLGRIERAVAGKRGYRRVGDDIVHGDLGLGNLLAHGGRISGIVDWDAAGCGDRALDLAKLFFYSYENAPIRERLRGRIVALAGHDGLCVYAAYTILAQLDWSIGHQPQSAVAEGVALAHAILGDLGVA